MRNGLTWVAAGACVVASPVPQQRPDLSGSWSATTEAPRDVATAPGAVLGARFALRFEGDQMTLSRPVRDEIVEATFRLDGTRTRVRLPGRTCEGDAALFETAVWSARGLVLTVVGSAPAGGGPVREVSAARLIRLEDPNTVVVEGTLVQAGQARTVATVYRRSDPLPAPTAEQPVAGAAQATIADVAWISGEWAGTTDGVTTEEHWLAPASGAIVGVARTVRNGLMTSYEFLCIAERQGVLVYSAMPDGRTTPTHFTLTSIDTGVAVFENPAHDYPTTIRYARRADGALETTISGASNQRARTVVLMRRD
ncbi:MAG: DUF6265 family protein [Gemmatimonadetes bacterium]|nr:DUF6265 family protein [Gemmatimonadota bacterium]